jgi:uncharacterized NAD-dependent epimerase/dehydratase family protein
LNNNSQCRIESPYLLFLGDVHDARYAKTANGVYQWRKELCLAQLRLPGCAADLGLPDLTPAEAAQRGAKSLLIGLAPNGGQIPDSWLPCFEDSLRAGLDVVSGMHDHLSDDARLCETADQYGGRIVDIRKISANLPVATGRKRAGKRLLTVGTDCAVGKMFTALSIEREMLRRGINAEFRATGQTGIMIAGSGICIDAVISDFAAGAAEVLAPENSPDHWDIIEGQGSLFHPSYAGVTLSLLHGSQPDYLVICHDASRETIVGVEGFAVPGFERCIEANVAASRLVNNEVSIAGICINTSSMKESEARKYLGKVAKSLGLPACDPLRTGVAEIVDRLS